jgi:SAM-dependent methyltransferase
MTEAPSSVVAWHDVECGGYCADLGLWEKLADEATGPVLDLGCGTGRVALHLARRDHRVLGVDADPVLVACLDDRAGALPVEAEVGDARGFDLGAEFGLALAPMQLVQLLADREERLACLSCVASHLRPGALFAAAIVEDTGALTSGVIERKLASPLPDTREVDGWVYSSLPLETDVDGDRIVVRRLRQIVSPAGELSEEVDEVRLSTLSAGELEGEAEAAGLRPAGRHRIEPTDEHVGSTVVLLERAA